MYSLPKFQAKLSRKQTEDEDQFEFHLNENHWTRYNITVMEEGGSRHRQQRVASYSSIKRSRAFRSEKKFTQPLATNPSEQNFQAFINALDGNEVLIEHCIDELKEKLNAIKQSPKQRQNTQLMRRKQTPQKQGQSSNRVKSVQTNSYDRFKSASKKQGVRPLRNINDIRDNLKRARQSERRVATEKHKERYDSHEDEDMPTAHKRRVGGSSRTNTEQVTRSQSNPARVYRYLSTASKDSRGKENNRRSLKCDQIINVSQNINIYHDPRRRVKREGSEDCPRTHSPSRIARVEHHQNPAIRQTLIANNQKVGDISTINHKKETLNSMGDSCIALQRDLEPRQIEEVSKLLDFVGWKTSELKKALVSSSQQQKRRHGLDKLSKIFPKGFFS